MKKSRGLISVSMFCVVLYSAQDTRQIDTININKSKENYSKVSIKISKKDLEKSVGGNLKYIILKDVSGVTLLQSGANISKPVIQGLSNQRIMVLNNGVKISQQWGGARSRSRK